MQEQEHFMRETVSFYEDIKENYSQERLVELLREIQDIYGCIPEDVQEYISMELQVKPVLIRSILKFFPSLRSVKRHEILLCMGPRCSKKGSSELAEAIREELYRSGEPGMSSQFVFRTRNCMKECKTSPNLKIDGRLYPGVRPEEMKKILKEVANQKPKNR